jgi:hypothetical protein
MTEVKTPDQLRAEARALLEHADALEKWGRERMKAEEHRAGVEAENEAEARRRGYPNFISMVHELNEPNGDRKP